MNVVDISKDSNKWSIFNCFSFNEQNRSLIRGVETWSWVLCGNRGGKYRQHCSQNNREQTLGSIRHAQHKGTSDLLNMDICLGALWNTIYHTIYTVINSGRYIIPKQLTLRTYIEKCKMHIMLLRQISRMCSIPKDSEL